MPLIVKQQATKISISDSVDLMASIYRHTPEETPELGFLSLPPSCYKLQICTVAEQADSCLLLDWEKAKYHNQVPLIDA